MKKSPVYLIFLVWLGTACGSEKDGIGSSQSTNLDSLFQVYHEYKLRINPVEATKAGEKEYNDYIANYLSDEYIEDCISNYQRFLEAINKVDTTIISSTDHISLKAMKWDCSIKLEGLQNKIVTIPSPVFDLPHFKLMPLTQISSFQLYIGQMASGASIQPFDTVEDYKNWLKRVDDYLDWLETAQRNMKTGIQQGLVIPKILIERTIAQLEPFANVPLEEHIFYGPVANFPQGFSDETKTF
ncbi:MAG: DUF885 family protein [Cyclobacteriaceae bacterium]